MATTTNAGASNINASNTKTSATKTPSTKTSTTNKKSASNNAKNGQKQQASKNKQSPPKQHANNSAISEFHKTHRILTGTSNYVSPVSSNIVFLAGSGLILASGWPRIKAIFNAAWNPTFAKANPNIITNNLRIIGVQILFVAGMTFTARLFPALGRMWLIMLLGTWILFLMKNPQIFKLLQVAGATNTTSAVSATPALGAVPGAAQAWDFLNNIATLPNASNSNKR